MPCFPQQVLDTTDILKLRNKGQSPAESGLLFCRIHTTETDLNSDDGRFAGTMPDFPDVLRFRNAIAREIQDLSALDRISCTKRGGRGVDEDRGKAQRRFHAL